MKTVIIVVSHLSSVTFDWGQSFQRRNCLVIDEVIVLFGWIEPKGQSSKRKTGSHTENHQWNYRKRTETVTQRMKCSLSTDNIHGEPQCVLHTVRLTLVVTRQDTQGFSLVENQVTERIKHNNNVLLVRKCFSTFASLMASLSLSKELCRYANWWRQKI